MSTWTSVVPHSAAEACASSRRFRVLGLIATGTLINYLDRTVLGSLRPRWTLVSDIALEGMLGVTGGAFNLAANLAGMITPLVIGAIVAETRGFFYALGFIALMALLEALAYIFALGSVERIVITH